MFWLGLLIGFLIGTLLMQAVVKIIADHENSIHGPEEEPEANDGK